MQLYYILYLTVWLLSKMHHHMYKMHIVPFLYCNITEFPCTGYATGGFLGFFYEGRGLLGVKLCSSNLVKPLFWASSAVIVFSEQHIMCSITMSCMCDNVCILLWWENIFLLCILRECYKTWHLHSDHFLFTFTHLHVTVSFARH